jgi:hypothetical protein
MPHQHHQPQHQHVPPPTQQQPPSTATIPLPPQPPQPDPDLLIPKAPYYELPAGMMLPLISDSDITVYLETIRNFKNIYHQFCSINH